MGIKSFLKSFDTYGQPLSMYHCGNETLRTKFGGFIRLLALGAVAYYYT